MNAQLENLVSSWLSLRWLAGLCLIGWIVTCDGAEYVSEGTRKMAERLQRIATQVDPLKTPFLNHAAAKRFGSDLEGFLKSPEVKMNPTKQIGLRFKYALELLNSGATEKAIQEFTKLQDHLDKNQVTLAPEKAAVLRMQMIIAWLRLGEQQNCVAHHTIDSCLMPIRAGGVHEFKTGSQNALALLEKELELNGQNLKARWLLNLAHMTLGTYPEKVPGGLLIPERVFASEYPLPRFPDIAGGLGLDINDLAGGVVLEDFDNDHDLDLMISAWGLQDQLRYFRNNGDGTFTDATKTAGIMGETGGLNMVQADYDNDGFIDVFILRGAWWQDQGHHPNSLLRNNGNGTFDDVTERAGLLSFHPTQTATWFDFDGDGCLDLFIGNESDEQDRNPCELYRNQGDGTFKECAAACGIDALGLIKAVHSGDFDNDGRPDLYISCRGQLNFLYRNDGPLQKAVISNQWRGWKFTNVAREAGVTEPRYSFPAWFFDFDNDGWLDIFTAGYGIRDVGDVGADYLDLPHGAARARLYRNRGDGTFADDTKAAGLYRVLLGMSGNFGDLDNDGCLDFYLGTGDPDLSTLIPNRMFRNEQGRKFQDVTTAGGFGHLQKGHGIAFGDIDHDGDQDIYASIGGAYEGDVYRNALFLNPGSTNRWLKVKLIGKKSNRAGIGARIKVTVDTGSGERAIYKTVNSGGAFGASPLRQEIGLGNAVAIRTLEVWWPASGTTNYYRSLGMNRCYEIEEGSRTARAINLKPVQLARKAVHSHPH